ncbi:GNAT family N-acetyltransferase [Oceanobacillus bengalensis]|uniref:GNAT family N-acetyltransferase n=1 Tax=Oceanobacillus bengalensis TaxID=1435466 RepID=A0A494Z0C4_9BACI|nr:GNAT family N-acetyltransferase [Oceanobacillus bengalensis]RKQ15903.1 GNAT family N-acetyltransferase [Oceanobacillus bengalensis]
MLGVRLIEPEMTYSLRHRVLRPNQSIEDSKYEIDHEAHTFHVGAFYQGKLISVASFVVENLPDFSIERQYRLRQMATLEEFRKLGAGRSIVDFGENIIRARGYDLIWCKGRTAVQEYYRKLGFDAYGDIFDYPPIGPHIVMYKKLQK